MEPRLSLAVAGALEVNLAELLRQRLCQTIYVPAPGAGAEFSVTVPNVAYWELLAATYVLSTSAVVANRRSSLRVRDPNNVLMGQSDAIAVQAASLVVPYAYQYDLSSPQSNVVDTQSVPLFGVPLMPGWKIGSVTQNLDVGDAYTGVVLQIREWTFEEIVRQAEWLERHIPQEAA